MAKEKALGPIRMKTCKDCLGWQFVPGVYPMQFCHCVKPTEHKEFRPPEGVRLIHEHKVVPAKERAAQREQTLADSRNRQRFGETNKGGFAGVNK